MVQFPIPMGAFRPCGSDAAPERVLDDGTSILVSGWGYPAGADSSLMVDVAAFLGGSFGTAISDIDIYIDWYAESSTTASHVVEFEVSVSGWEPNVTTTALTGLTWNASSTITDNVIGSPAGRPYRCAVLDIATLTNIEEGYPFWLRILRDVSVANNMTGQAIVNSVILDVT